MKYNVSVAGKTYEVEIENINVRPIIAKVDGEVFEVTPENGINAAGSAVRMEKAGAEKTTVALKATPTASPSPSQTLSGNTLTAPLPGTITEVFVRPGDEIETGQVMLVIEAMKMKNSIRAVRGGIIAEVLVSAGQTVAHKQALVKFQE
jgi:glutaconyl-CoA/methylmalonyl-CoA decarboxylase subunit gamma